MKRILLYLGAFFSVALFLSGCEKLRPLPDVVQPIVKVYSSPDTFYIGNTTVITGPKTIFEQESDVIFKIDATSGTELSTFKVTSSSDALSDSSRIIMTDPVDAIDEDGNFMKKLNDVTIYYKYHIHGLVPPLSTPELNFTVVNASNYSGNASEKFTVVKQGSHFGKPFQIIDMTWANRFRNGISVTPGNDSHGTFLNPMPAQGLSPGGGPPILYNIGVFYSLGMEEDFSYAQDAVAVSDKIDLVGNRISFAAGTDPVLNVNDAYICSPSDTAVLGYYYAGAEVARLTFNGGATGSSIQISGAGVTKTLTWATNLSTSLTNFVNANKAAYSAAGLNVKSSSTTLTFTLKNKGTWFGPVTTKPLTGNWWTNDYYGTWDPWSDMFQAHGTALLRWWVQKSALKLKNEGKHLRVVYFKRLDNITTDDKLTPEECDKLLYDNDIDKYTAGIVPGQPGVDLRCGPVVLHAVYGFVMDDGRKGLIRTQDATGLNDPLITNNEPITVNVNDPLANDWNLAWRVFCTIYVSNP